MAAKRVNSLDMVQDSAAAARGVDVLDVVPGSAADEAGLEPGDRIIAINGRDTPDELALRFHLSEEPMELSVLDSRGVKKRLEIILDDNQHAGWKLAEFATRTCANACIFCFVDQLPPGVRSELLTKDDDFRLSFLYGNYITLTNNSSRDLDRIIEHRLSPLYISVHATDPDLRGRILGRAKPDNILAKMKRLVRAGIRIHAQIVLMPGINDGSHLEKTVQDLYALYPGVDSTAIVPVGLSDHGSPGRRLTPVTPEYSREVIRAAVRWQQRFRQEIGRTFAHLADEFYLQGGVDVPEADHYDDFEQIEDGVGMVRVFLDQFEAEAGRWHRTPVPLDGTLVTGKLFRPILQRCIRRYNRLTDSRLKVCGAASHFMGKRITVAGLLSGRDIERALRGREPGQFLVVPGEALALRSGLFLDDLKLRDLSVRLGLPVYSGGRSVRDFFRLLGRLQRRFGH